MADFEDSFHFGETLFRAGGPGTDGLGAVHAGTSTETDDGLAVVGKIEIQGLLDVGSSGIGNSSVVDDAGDSGIGQSLFEALCEAELSDAAVGDEGQYCSFSFPEEPGSPSRFPEFSDCGREGEEEPA